MVEVIIPNKTENRPLSSGTPFALKHNGSVYYYITNLQGDVLFLVDADGETVAEYTYDPYGKVLTATGTMAEVNPLRYRGYYYDAETGFYYLQSRYYDPTVCRFINFDNQIVLGDPLGINMFTYCGNEPITFVDEFGNRREYVRCTDGGRYVPVGGSSDGRMESDVLLQYLKDSYKGTNGPTYYYTVRYVGVYNHTADYTTDNLSFALGGISIGLSAVPIVRETAWISNALAFFGIVEWCAEGVELYHKKNDTLAYKEYRQYHVTLRYNEDTVVNGKMYRTAHEYELYFLRDDTSYSNPGWHFQKGIDNSCSFYID